MVTTYQTQKHSKKKWCYFSEKKPRNFCRSNLEWQQIRTKGILCPVSRQYAWYVERTCFGLTKCFLADSAGVLVRLWVSRLFLQNSISLVADGSDFETAMAKFSLRKITYSLFSTMTETKLLKFLVYESPTKQCFRPGASWRINGALWCFTLDILIFVKV